MIEVVKINEYLINIAPFLKLRNKWVAVKQSVNKTGNKAGYNLKLAIKFPFNNSMKERCIPQPGQSMPDICL